MFATFSMQSPAPGAARTPTASPQPSLAKRGGLGRGQQALGLNRRAGMHKSQLAGFNIDCKTEHLEQAAKFWSAALGYPLRALADESAADKYRQLMTGPDGLHLEVQKVGHDSRLHLDIETDDIEAEVKRLEALGARCVQQIQTWWV